MGEGEGVGGGGGLQTHLACLLDCEQSLSSPKFSEKPPPRFYRYFA